MFFCIMAKQLGAKEAEKVRKEPFTVKMGTIIGFLAQFLDCRMVCLIGLVGAYAPNQEETDKFISFPSETLYIIIALNLS